MPVIHTQPGGVAFAAGKSIGMIEREKEEYTRGVEQARLDLQKEQVENARQERELARIQREEQDNLAEIWRQKQFTAQQEAAKLSAGRWEKGFGLQEKQFEFGKEKFKEEWQAKEDKRLEDVEWMKKILGQVESGDVKVSGVTSTGKPRFKVVDKDADAKKTMLEMQKVSEAFQLKGYELVEEGVEPPAGAKVDIDRFDRAWYKISEQEEKKQTARERNIEGFETTLQELKYRNPYTGAEKAIESVSDMNKVAKTWKVNINDPRVSKAIREAKERINIMKEIRQTFKFAEETDWRKRVTPRAKKAREKIRTLSDGRRVYSADGGMTVYDIETGERLE